MLRLSAFLSFPFSLRRHLSIWMVYCSLKAAGRGAFDLSGVLHIQELVCSPSWTGGHEGVTGFFQSPGWCAGGVCTFGGLSSGRQVPVHVGLFLWTLGLCPLTTFVCSLWILSLMYSQGCRLDSFLWTFHAVTAVPSPSAMLERVCDWPS